MLPGVASTGRHVEIPHVVVMKFRNNRISHEHIYWDQASVLAQIASSQIRKNTDNRNRTNKEISRTVKKGLKLLVLWPTLKQRLLLSAELGLIILYLGFSRLYLINPARSLVPVLSGAFANLWLYLSATF